MTNPDTVLASHIQHYRMSCAASGMEIVLKLHSLVESDYRALQDRYKDTNIGFEYLSDLAEFGITAISREDTISAGFQRIESEVKEGRFPLLSVHNESLGWHVWVAVPIESSFRLLSRSFNNPHTHEISDLNTVRLNLTEHRNGQINFATYVLYDYALETRDDS